MSHVSSVDLAFDRSGVSRTAQRLVYAAGPGMNLLSGLALTATAPLVRERPAALRFAWWLGTYASLFVGATYFLGLSFAPYGDVAGIVGDLPYAPAAGLATTAFGLAVEVWAVVRAARALVPLVDDRRAARRLVVTSYLAIGLGAVAAGAFNPTGPALVVLSAAAESFGGQSALLFVADIAMRMRARSGDTAAAPGLPRSPAWIAAGGIAALLWIAVLGPGLPRGR